MNSAMNNLMKLLAGVTVCFSGAVWAQCDTTVAATTPAARFTVMDNTVVQDLDTGLQWQRCPLGASWSISAGCVAQDQMQYTWDQALATANGGWRLPNKKELASIIEYRCRLPAINAQLFPVVDDGASGDVYWTSTPLIYFSQPTVWAIDFADGAFVNRAASERLKVRLVRD